MGKEPDPEKHSNSGDDAKLDKEQNMQDMDFEASPSENSTSDDIDDAEIFNDDNLEVVEKGNSGSVEDEDVESAENSEKESEESEESESSGNEEPEDLGKESLKTKPGDLGEDIQESEPKHLGEDVQEPKPHDNAKAMVQCVKEWSQEYCHICTCFWNFFGVLFALFCGFVFAKYMQELHEVVLWFSHIKLVEKEISLRTEAGFYYSYFKQLVNPNVAFSDGLQELVHDIRAEHPREINALQRFNIYQEVFLALLYRILSHIPLLTDLHILPSPIMFYVYSCFAFAGLAVTALYLITWKLTKSWLFGILVFAWMTVNHQDSTRVFFTVNMREVFALPFFWFQNLYIVEILGSVTGNFKYHGIFYVVTTLYFALFWQFNQFILLLQSMALCSIALIYPSQNRKIRILLILQTIGFVLALLAQFMQPLTIVSVSVSFNLSAILVLYLASFFDKYRWNFVVTALVKTLLIVTGTVMINLGTRLLASTQPDSHIWTFVKAKLGLPMQGPIPLETSLYLCHGAFAMIDSKFFEQTRASGVLPLYCLALIVIGSMVVRSIIQRSFQKANKEEVPEFDDFIPLEIVFLAIQSVPFGLVALLTLRMKYLWFPYIAIIAAYFISMWSKLSLRIPTRIIAVAIAIALLYRHYDYYKNEMGNEREFWDPDTVELMDWISNSTPPDSSWTGSMQLMAAVKACTGRKLVNHPHFEDKWLRDRTARLYQIYARDSVENVYNIMRDESVDYVIIEESICRAPSRGCSTKDLMDLQNGIMPESGDLGNFALGGELKTSKVPRFCDQVQKITNKTKKYFHLAFENRIFRVYEVQGGGAS